MSKKLIWKLISIVRVWFQTFLGIEIAMHIKDIADGKFIWQVCLGSFIPVLIRWATPHDDFPDERVK